MEHKINEQMLRTSVRGVLNAWTALKIAVEERMGGSNSHMHSFLLIDEILSVLHSEKGQISPCDIADVLSDYMDQKFNVICEDGSPDEVAEDLVNFFNCYQTQDLVTFTSLLNRLPVVPEWLPSENVSPPGMSGIRLSAVPEQSACEEPMDTSSLEESVKPSLQDTDGWTTVTNKKKPNS